MLCDKYIDPEVSEDSDEDRDTKHNLLDVDEGGLQDMIEEEDEGAECDDHQYFSNQNNL